MLTNINADQMLKIHDLQINMLKKDFPFVCWRRVLRTPSLHQRELPKLVSVCSACSTSPPGGKLVDGSPPVAHQQQGLGAKHSLLGSGVGHPEGQVKVVVIEFSNTGLGSQGFVWDRYGT